MAKKYYADITLKVVIHTDEDYNDIIDSLVLMSPDAIVEVLDTSAELTDVK